MGKPFSAATLAIMRQKLSLPDDASVEQIREAVDALVAKADARDGGTVAASGFQAAFGLPAEAPERTVLAAASTLMLQNAKRLGMSATSPPSEIRAAMDVERRVLARAAASRATPAGAAVAASAGAAPSGRVAASTASDPGAHYASNPELGEAELRSPEDVRAAYEVSPQAPTLFNSGDVPVTTASDLPPVTLRAIPWYARHAVAAESDQSKAYEMYEELSGPDGVFAAQDPKYRNHPGNAAYQERVTQWVLAGAAHRREQMAEEAERAAQQRQQMVAASVGEPEEMTDEQVFESVYGDLHRQRAAKAAADERAAREGRAVGQPRRW